MVNTSVNAEAVDLEAILLHKTITRWCSEQVEFWERRDLDYAKSVIEYRRESLLRPFLFVFHAQGIRVTFEPELGFFDAPTTNAAISRALLYQAFLQSSLEHHGATGEDVIFALDVGDKPLDSEVFPIFGFEKSAGSNTILLPDVEFFSCNYYSAKKFQDTTEYLEKLNSAIFIGSTTGGDIITQAKIDAGLVQRIKSALFFAKSDYVDFRLPRLIHLDSLDTEESLRTMGFGVGEATWQEQFQHRFLISMDGNGAACSRLVMGLASKSVLLKYDSNRILFYFSSLRPWQHYIPICDDGDVLTIVEQELVQPGKYASIAEAGREFFLTYLNQSILEWYAHILLRRYAVAHLPSVGVPFRSSQEPLNFADDAVKLLVSNQEGNALLNSDSVSVSTSHSLQDHAGTDYRAVIRNLHLWLNPKTYLEVGVEGGHTLMLAACRSIGVDPAFNINDPNVFARLLASPSFGLYQMPSDEFFEKFDPAAILGAPIDLAFLDGMHRCEFLLRDFINTERRCSRNSVILLHDCLPVEVGMADRIPGATAIMPHRQGWWTGDTWRTMLLLKRHRPDLKILCLDAAPTGLVCVTNLDPTSNYLSENYFSLVGEMRDWNLEVIGLDKLMSEVVLCSTSLIDSEEKSTMFFAVGANTI